MLVAVKDVQPKQIIKDASGTSVIVEDKTVSEMVGGGVILVGLRVWDGLPWSSRFVNPDEEVEVVLSDSK